MKPASPEGEGEAGFGVGLAGLVFCTPAPRRGCPTGLQPPPPPPAPRSHTQGYGLSGTSVRIRRGPGACPQEAQCREGHQTHTGLKTHCARSAGYDVPVLRVSERLRERSYLLGPQKPRWEWPQPLAGKPCMVVSKVGWPPDLCPHTSSRGFWGGGRGGGGQRQPSPCEERERPRGGRAFGWPRATGSSRLLPLCSTSGEWRPREAEAGPERVHPKSGARYLTLG